MTLNDLTLNQLRIFQLVAKYSNITRAAQEMRISQPSISRHLKALQEHFGVKFLTRSVHGIKLTNEGCQFLDAVKPILLQIDVLENIISNKGVEKKASYLKFGAGESPSISLMPKLFRLFNQTHPKVQLFLRTNHDQAIEQMLERSEVEIAITTSPSVNSKFVSEPFLSAEVVAVVSSRSPLSKKRKFSLQDLSTIPVITKVSRRIASQIERQLGIKLNIVLECESVEAIKAAVNANIGIGFLYRDTVELDLRHGYLRKINMPPLKKLDAKWYILYKKGGAFSPNAKDFLALLRKTFTGCRTPSLQSIVHELS